MNFYGWQQISFLDYPGKVSTIVFTDGCNLKCPWCHNPKLVKKSSFKKKFSEKQIIDFIKEKNKFQKWIDAIVICGGEPTIHKNLAKFLIKIKEETNALIKIDTNGTNPEYLRTLIKMGLVDYVAMDVKPGILLNDKSLRDVGLKAAYLESIQIVKKAKDYEFRLTCVPGFVTSENIEKILKNFYGSKVLYLQQFHNDSNMIDNTLKQITPYIDDVLLMWKKKFQKHFNKIEIR